MNIFKINIVSPSFIILFMILLAILIWKPLEYIDLKYPQLPASYFLYTSFLLFVLILLKSIESKREFYTTKFILEKQDVAIFRKIISLLCPFLFLFMAYIALIALSGFLSGGLNGARKFVNEHTPTFGIVFLHLKTALLIAFIYIKGNYSEKKRKFFISYFIIMSIIYGFLMGERIFIMESILSVIVAMHIRDRSYITFKFIIFILLFFLSIFVGVEFIKIFFHEELNLDINRSISLGYYLERILLYYLDPLHKLLYVIDNDLGFQNWEWFRASIGVYIERFGIDIPHGHSANYFFYADGYGGPVLTNTGGFTTLFIDFGYLSFIFVLIYFIFSAGVFRLAIKNEIFSLVFYPYLLLSLYEFPRVAYLYWPRFWLPVLIILSLILIIKCFSFRKKLSTKFIY